jgi:hypothetical protein
MVLELDYSGFPQHFPAAPGASTSRAGKSALTIISLYILVAWSAISTIVRGCDPPLLDSDFPLGTAFAHSSAAEVDRKPDVQSRVTRMMVTYCSLNVYAIPESSRFGRVLRVSAPRASFLDA